MRIALAQGYKVRAVVRKEAQVESLRSHSQIARHVDNVEFVVVPDMAKMGAFDGVMEGVSVVLHLASPLAIEVCLTVPVIFEQATDSRIDRRLWSRHPPPSHEHRIVRPLVGHYDPKRETSRHNVLSGNVDPHNLARHHRHRHNILLQGLEH